VTGGTGTSTKLQRRGALLGLLALVVVAVACTTPGGPLPPPAGVGDPIVGVNPDIQGTPGAQVKTIRYGPWTVPAATGTGHANAGMIKDKSLIGAERPCGDCYVTGITVDLKYPDGRVANSDTGLWLHHT
jgi:hypothetical protein